MLNRERLQDGVIKHIIGRIANGVYPKGTRLPSERRLCTEFNVSRGTLRKGMAELRRLGIVTIRHGSGCYANRLLKPALASYGFTRKGQARVSLNDIITARQAIELAAVRQAVHIIRHSTIRRLTRLIDQMVDTVDLTKSIALDMQFHQILVAASRNPVLSAAFEAIQPYHKYSQIFTSYGPREKEMTLAHHRRIIRALKQGHAVAVLKALSHHLDVMKEYERVKKEKNHESDCQ
ncbi:MAG: FCD domain-containing protein [Verrucomicrobia bacterium]|nr:FCD domain-containing protein [Verrucomicrobiota bacterium]MBU1735541.1 FCD domain-containing protein [Verrucomicrobiota bacterium]MBU1858008.1 FCD domain-containing protein [Verrucomicrobiota bacterium]